MRWLCDLCGYGEAAWGVLTSGGVMANIMAITVARDVHLAKLLGTEELPRGARLEGARIYASDQTHFSVERAVDLLGFPEGTLRIVPSDDGFRLRAEPVAAAIVEDRAAGLTPFAISAVAGSTNTGSVDDVSALADLAEREGLWLHVDAAYGAAARLSGREAHKMPGPRTRGLAHRRPAQVALPAVRHRRAAREASRRSASHLPPRARVLRDLGSRGASAPLVPVLARGHPAIPCSQALAVVEAPRLRRLRTSDRAKRRPRPASRRSGEELGFEVIEPELAVVCLRLAPSGLDPERTDELQRRLQRALEVSGVGWLSTTTLRGGTWLRAGVINYLSTETDADRILDTLVDASQTVIDELDK